MSAMPSQSLKSVASISTASSYCLQVHKGGVKSMFIAVATLTFVWQTKSFSSCVENAAVVAKKPTATNPVVKVTKIRNIIVSAIAFFDLIFSLRIYILLQIVTMTHSSFLQLLMGLDKLCNIFHFFSYIRNLKDANTFY